MGEPDAVGSSVESFEDAVAQALDSLPAIENIERFTVAFSVERGGFVPGSRYGVSLTREPPTQ